jgi:hypothetical protein
MDIRRIAHPSPDEFARAAEICHLRWSYLAELDTPARLAGLAKLGVELVVAEENGRMEGVCFVLPSGGELDGERIEWVYLFQLATGPESGNIGGMLMWRIMSLYPAILSLGVTDVAERMYQVLRWKRYDQVWRGVHPICMARMLEDYGDRIQTAWQRHALRGLALVHDVAAPAWEALLGWGVPCQVWNPAGEPTGKQEIVAGYLEWFRAPSLDAVNAGGAARIAGKPRLEFSALRQHAALWRALRRRGAKFCEVLLTSPAAKQRAKRLGYAPLAMPAWYWDKSGALGKWLACLPQREFSFLDTDKIL